MPIPVTCPECFMDYSIPERFAGKKIKCKSCGAAIPVPRPGAEAAADDLDDLGPAFAPGGPPPRPGQVRPAAGPAKAAKKGKTSVWVWVGGIFGGLAVMVLLCCGGVTLWWKGVTTNVNVAEYKDLPDFGDPTSPFPVAQIAVPKFPDLGPATPVGDTGVRTHEIDLAGVPGNAGAPGMKMKMRVYLPPGEHAAKSLPCVLVAPAGSTLLEGMDLNDGGYHDETLPYAQAGMAVVHYSLDGGSEVFDDEKASIKAPYLHFRAACAGVVNTRNALEFALAKLPMVDPNKVFTAGHSSAGTLALLAAEHEPRVAGAVAYAPATDLLKRMEGVEDAPEMVTGIMFPRMKEFLTQSSPATHAAALKCPVFLFQSKDDGNVPFADTEAFAARLRTAGKDVTLEAVDSAAPAAGAGEEQGRDLAAQPPGFDVEDAASADEAMSDEEMDESDGYDSHYTPMIKEGIPRAIRWIKQKTGT